MQKRVMNLVNFVRGCEPRDPNVDLYTPIAEEIAINKQYGFDHTVLVQYDALILPDILELLRREADEHMEIGLWFEMGRPLTEKVGIEWRGRPGYDWDWFVDPGFLPAYTPAEREALIDEAFRLFREIFGYYPAVAGSWLFDSYSLAYMSDKYQMKAFCVCREQWAVDAYTLWGGYYNGGYYPSRRNMLSPAQSEELSVKTPLYRMLGIDPTYGYDENKYAATLTGCPTLEPVWGPGASARIVDVLFRSYYETPCLTQAYATTGQENSFGWPNIGPGYKMQAEKLDALVRAGKVSVEKLGDTGAAMQATTPITPAAAMVALEDWAHDGTDPAEVCKSVWYSSVYYRANLFLRGDRLIVRDLHKFDDRYEERYLTNPCHEWQATYDTLPLVEGRIWSTPDAPSEIRLPGAVAAIDVAESGETLTVTLTFAGGRKGTVTLTPAALTLTGCGPLTYTLGGNPTAAITYADGALVATYRDFGYRVPVTGTVTPIDGGFALDGETVALDMGARD